MYINWIQLPPKCNNVNNVCNLSKMHISLNDDSYLSRKFTVSCVCNYCIKSFSSSLITSNNICAPKNHFYIKSACTKQQVTLNFPSLPIKYFVIYIFFSSLQYEIIHHQPLSTICALYANAYSYNGIAAA